MISSQARGHPRADLSGSGERLSRALAGVRRTSFGSAATGAAHQLGTLWRQLTAPSEPGKEAGDGTDRALLISVSDAGWCAAFPGVSGETREVLAEESTPPGAEGDAVLAGIKRAIRAIPAHQREIVGSVSLLVGDPAIDLVDSRAMRLRSMDPVVLRQAGSQQLGTEASYGFVPFGQSSERELPRGLFAFAPVTRIRAYLSALEMLAPKLVRIIPAGAVTIVSGGAEPFAALDIRGQSSTLVLADPESGSVSSREIAIGIMTLAAALAEGTSIPLKDALAGLERRDCLPDPQATPGSSVARTATERALGPVLAALRDDLKASFDYFTYQRLGGQPQSVVVTGEVGRVQGLGRWLTGAVGLPIEAGTPFGSRDLQEAGAKVMNLLEGAPDGLLTIGKVEYTYVEGRFRPKQTRAESRRVADRRAAERRSAERRTGDRRAGSRRRNDGGDDHAAPGFRGRLADSAALLANLASHPGFGEIGRRLKSSAALVPMGAAACAAGALWLTAVTADASAEAAVDRLTTANAADAALRTSLASQQVAARPEDGSQRYLWTEKLLTIAGAMPEGMWLTDLSVLTDAAPKAAQRLVLQGAMHAGDSDRLRTVTSFIERLSADTTFMRDFRAVTFDGETSGQESGRSDIARVTISIWFDEARRRDKPGARKTAGAAP